MHPNLVMDSGVHSSLLKNCHHQITHAKFKHKIYYLPPYEQEIWHYQKANMEIIRKAIDQFPFRSISLHQFKLLQSKLNSLIKNSKFNYFACLSKKLSDPMTS